MKRILIVGGIMAVVGILCVSLVSAMTPERTPVEDTPEQMALAAATGDAFFSALANGNFARAYRMLAPNVRQEFGDAAGLASAAEMGSIRTFDRAAATCRLEDSTCEMQAGVTYVDGRSGSVQLTLVRLGGEWKIGDFRFR